MIPRIDFAILIVTVLYALLQVRVLSYASLIVAPPIAGFLALPRPGKRTTLSPRQKIKFAAIAVATCGLVFAAAMMIKRATGEQSAQTSSNDFRGCIDRASAAALNELPPGLILNDMDLGAHILAETRDLRVFSAPYHRIGANIAATHDIFFSSPEEARKRILATGADYVAVCPGLGSTVPLTPPPADALKLLLLTDNAPAFLERVRLKEDTPIRVWRVVTPRPLALIREAVREPSGLSIE